MSSSEQELSSSSTSRSGSPMVEEDSLANVEGEVLPGPGVEERLTIVEGKVSSIKTQVSSIKTQLQQILRLLKAKRRTSRRKRC